MERVSLYRKLKEQVEEDIIQKKGIKNIHEVPKLKSITCNIGLKKRGIKSLQKEYNKRNQLLALLALELITGQRGRLTKSTKDIQALNIRKAQIVGSKVTLHNQQMYSFLNDLIFNILPKIPTIQFSYTRLSNCQDSFTFTLYNPFLFNQLETQYHLFFHNPLPPFNISFTFFQKSSNSSLLLLNALLYPSILQKV